MNDLSQKPQSNIGAVSSCWCLRIHKSQIPKKLKLNFNKDGWLHGYLIFSEKDYKAVFMNDTVQFECSRPFVITQTHLLIKYSAVVYTGYDKFQKQVGEICELTFFFNGC
jgi:hypothetical protein